MSKMYELTVLIHPDLEANLDDALSKVKNIITEAGGKIEKENIWGKKKLAYQINREDFAVYVYFEVALPPEAPIVISNTLNITETDNSIHAQFNSNYNEMELENSLARSLQGKCDWFSESWNIYSYL